MASRSYLRQGGTCSRAYDTTEENLPQMREEAEVVKARADKELQEAQEKVQEQKAPAEEETPARRLIDG
jgi:hypothetical protein